MCSLFCINYHPRRSFVSKLYQDYIYINLVPWTLNLIFWCFLQHVVRFRWDELHNVDRRNFANVAVDSISEISNPFEEWVFKSQTAALVAEVFCYFHFWHFIYMPPVLLLRILLLIFLKVVRREGLSIWSELLPTIITLSNKGPIQVEHIFLTYFCGFNRLHS